MIETILDCLNETHARATYGAVAAVIGGGPRNVSPLLAPRRPRASWVVNATTGMPTGYTTAQMDPALTLQTPLVRTGADLKALLQKWQTRGGPRGRDGSTD